MNALGLHTIFQLSPVLILAITGLFVLLIDLFYDQPSKQLIIGLGLTGIVASGLATTQLWMGDATPLFYEAIRIDRFGLLVSLIILGLTFLTLLSSHPLIKQEKRIGGEYLFFVLTAAAGMIIMVWSTDLLTFFMSLELMSLSVYILTGIQSNNKKGIEGAFKYFLLGAFSTGFLLYGIALIYASAGSTHYADIASFLVTARYTLPVIFYIGLSLLLIGFGFKIGAAPFHMWVPDVYEAAHSTVSGFMATAVKTAAFAAFIRLFLVTLFSLKSEWQTLILLLAVATMTVGNISALIQQNLKRMLAYSSIAHAGYLLVAFTVAQSQLFNLSITAMLFYLIAYGLMTLGAFAVISIFSQTKDRSQLSDFAGAGYSHPWLAAAFALFMLSLTGIPLTAGFIGKFYIFSAALKSQFYALAVFAIINSLISAYYYLRVLAVMYMKEEGETASIPVSIPLAITIGISAVGTLLFGIFPQPALTFIETSIFGLL